MRKHPIEQKTAALLVSLIDIYGTYERFKSVAVDITVMLATHATGVDKTVYAYFNGKFIQSLTTDEIAARLREKTLTFLAETGLEEIGRDRTEHSVAKKFQALITTQFA